MLATGQVWDLEVQLQQGGVRAGCLSKCCKVQESPRPAR